MRHLAFITLRTINLLAQNVLVLRRPLHNLRGVAQLTAIDANTRSLQRNLHEPYAALARTTLPLRRRRIKHKKRKGPKQTQHSISPGCFFF
jgi:hypothetical protein